MGAPEVVRVFVECSQDQYENGFHYGMAQELCSEHGYDPGHPVFDENDIPDDNMASFDAISYDLPGEVLP